MIKINKKLFRLRQSIFIAIFDISLTKNLIEYYLQNYVKQFLVCLQ